MLDNITKNITKIFDSLAFKKYISEEDLNLAMREIRVALLEADVSLAVAKDFIEKVKQEALGQQVIKSVSAGQMIVKILHDELIKLLGSEKSELNFNTKPPAVIMLVGLQGAGKTTSAGKLALRLKNKNHKKILLASLDTYRPAAQKQLEILAQKTATDSLPIIADEKPLAITKRALEQTVKIGYDVAILDTAGRTAINDELMQELQDIKNLANPTEILLVVDSLIGQDAINIAKIFHEKLNLTGIILTRLDGDGRGGVALTMKSSTNCPIKFIGVGEKLEDLDEFDPSRIASRIVGMGDVVSLVEKAKEVFNQEEMKRAEKKLRQGRFDFDDLLSQIRNMKKMGGMTSIIKFLPGTGKIREQMDKMPNIETELKRQEALILSMSKKERQNPDLLILNSSRKRRIANGSGSNIQEINRLLKKYKQMTKMMNKFGKIDPKKLQELMQQNQTDQGFDPKNFKF